MTLSRWPCLLRPSLISQIEGHVKKFPTLVFEKSEEHFDGGVVCLAQIIHVMGWVVYSKLIADSNCQWCLCMQTPILTLNMLTYVKRTCVLSSDLIHGTVKFRKYAPGFIFFKGPF